MEAKEYFMGRGTKLKRAILIPSLTSSDGRPDCLKFSALEVYTVTVCPSLDREVAYSSIGISVPPKLGQK